ncbi:MAG: DUF1592 domain-containing protein [Novosphingobium sp.]
MIANRLIRRLALGAAAAPLLLAGCTTTEGGAREGAAAAPASAPPATTLAAPLGNIVAMRRLTETQYRNAIADIFGPDIKVAGRFEPIVRPAHELIAIGALEASISPTGLEQFDAMARNIAAQVFDEHHRDQFVGCKPKDAAVADPACAGQVLAPLGRYLFRRPMTGEELAFFVKLAGEGAGPTRSFYSGLELALGAMLMAPPFLYVVETAEPDPAVPGGQRLDNYSTAARLSFLLWNTTPSEQLLAAAEAGTLTDPQVRQALAGSMVKSPRLENGVRAFFADMLLFEKFDAISKDPLVYPYFNQQVAQALPEQMLRMIVDHLLTRGGDYRELFTTQRTFMNRALGGLYQVPVARSDGWVPYTFRPEDERAGLLGQAGFLALYSHSGRSSPTLRGRAIRELLMCQPVPDPPGNVNFTAVQDTTNKAMPTARIRLTAHNSDEVCAGCHSITDPLGLPMEQFDGIGAPRLTENGAPIDVSGSMDGTPFSGTPGLGKALAASPDTPQCVATRALSYATGRGGEDVSALVEPVTAKFAQGGYSIRTLFLDVATMPEAYRAAAKPLDDPSHLTMLYK